MDRAVSALSDLTMPEFESLVSSWGKPAVHARKLLRRYYMGSGTVAWDLLELPKGFRERVEELGLMSSGVAARQEDPDGTVKLLLPT